MGFGPCQRFPLPCQKWKAPKQKVRPGQRLASSKAPQKLKGVTRQRAFEYTNACTRARILYQRGGGGHLKALRKIVDEMDTGDLDKDHIYRILTRGNRLTDALWQKDELVKTWLKNSTGGSANG